MSDLSRLFDGMRISSSGLAAERQRMDVIAENIANAGTTSTPDGGPYRRKAVRFEPILAQASLSGATEGVRVKDVVEDHHTPFERVHDLGHPDADADGWVQFPNVNTVMEMTDLISSMRAYEANLAAQESFMRMAQRALEIAR